MDNSSFRSNFDAAPAPADHRPAACPACRSSSIVTTAKNPNTRSYWRCEACGEVWNDARREMQQTVVRPWR